MVILLPNLALGPVCLTTMDGLPGSGRTQSLGHSSCPLMAQKDPKKTKMYNDFIIAESNLFMAGI